MFKYCLVMFCCGIIVNVLLSLLSFINFNFRILNSVDVLFLKIPHMRHINPTILNPRIDASNRDFPKIMFEDGEAKTTTSSN